MSDHVVELPAPVMSEDAFHRRREHLLAEIQRPASRRRHALAAVLVTAVLALMAFAPISGASLAHRVATGLGKSRWSSTAPPPKDPAEVQSFTDDWNTGPGASLHLNGNPVLGKARDLLSVLAR